MYFVDKPTDFDIFSKRFPNKIIVSKSLAERPVFGTKEGETNIEPIRNIRIASKMIETKELHTFIKENNELKLRITPNNKQQITAKFYEDTRKIFTLQFQRYTEKTGNPHEISFSFSGEEISVLINFLKAIPHLKLPESDGIHINDADLDNLVLNKEEALKILTDHKEVFLEVVNNDISLLDLISLNHKKSQLQKFEKLLYDEQYFESERSNNPENKKKGKESVWQSFFEQNTWIFGYGLNYIFNSPLHDKKLEQVVSGYTFNSSGKRIDALMKTRGIINSFCFGEIKTHKTELLRPVKSSYRDECWAISDELSGAIAQVQKTVQKSIEKLPTKNEIEDDSGYLTGEEVFIYQPKSFVIIGNLDEFTKDSKVNKVKFSSFELYRRNIVNPEIITFDELFERAKYIIEHIENR